MQEYENEDYNDYNYEMTNDYGADFYYQTQDYDDYDGMDLTEDCMSLFVYLFICFVFLVCVIV